MSTLASSLLRRRQRQRHLSKFSRQRSRTQLQVWKFDHDEWEVLTIKFREKFDVVRGDVLRASYGQNPWQEHDQVITSVSWVSVIDDARESLLRSRWDLVIVDEAHSSQGGKTTARMHEALGGKVAEDEFEEDNTQDTVNAEIEKRIASRKLLANASYFAFTATPKNKTLELGSPRFQCNK